MTHCNPTSIASSSRTASATCASENAEQASVDGLKTQLKTCIYEVNYFLRYSECFDKGTECAYVEAPEGLDAKRGELEKLCRTKFPEEFKIDSWRRIDVVKLV